VNATPVTTTGGQAFSPPSLSPDRRRFRIKHALRSLEDALTLLDTKAAAGIEIAALERVRDDLKVVLRLAEAECL
jgi:hypothetical protein